MSSYDMVVSQLCVGMSNNVHSDTDRVHYTITHEGQLHSHIVIVVCDWLCVTVCGISHWVIIVCAHVRKILTLLLFIAIFLSNQA